MFVNSPIDAIFGGKAIAVLGELKGLHQAWEAHGQLPWRELVLPVADLASKPIPISRNLRVLMGNIESIVLARTYPLLSDLLLDPNTGQLKQVGDTMHRPALATTLLNIAEQGSDYIYNTMASTLAAEVQANGGILTEADIRGYKVKVSQPLISDLFGYTYYGPAGSSAGGAAVVGVIKFMEGYTTPLVSQGLVYYHRLVEGMKHLFAMKLSLGDPAYINTTLPLAAMTSNTYMSQLRSITLDSSVLPNLNMYGGVYNLTTRPMPIIDSGTSHVSIIDIYGNAVSLTTTINTYFGSCIISPSTGIIFNNEMDDFSNPSNTSNYFNLASGPNNYPTPGKRPISSMSPSVLVSPVSGKVRLVVGGSGGPR